MSDFMGVYKRRNVSGAYGNPGQWRSAFRKRMSKEEAQEELQSEKPWGILDIPRDATWEVIRRAYRAACREWHPDLPKNHERFNKAVEMMKRINAAYTLLEYEYGKA